MENSSTGSLITIQTVYELASDIGEHFKKLLEQHGPELNQSLIPTVVRVLEYLEETVLQREDYMQLVDKLHRQIEDLQRGQHERFQQQQKIAAEYEDYEESWLNENIQLSQYIKHLRSENKRLASSLSEKSSPSLTDLKHTDDDSDAEESNKAKQNDFDKLARRISLLSKEIKLKNDEIDHLKSQNDNLLEENQNLRNLVVVTTRSNYTIPTVKETVEGKSVKNNIVDDQRQCMEEIIRELEEKIEMYKQRLKTAESRQSGGELVNDRNNNTDKVEVAVELREEEEETVKMEDLPVQGPIPDEALFYRERKSRIWSFFPRLTRALMK